MISPSNIRRILRLNIPIRIIITMAPDTVFVVNYLRNNIISGIDWADNPPQYNTPPIHEYTHSKSIGCRPS
jgi:hypothetical protein